ncbi:MULTISPECIES: sterol desaturase family protein [unclassified Streptomyces]|uniref:sterol desaturase family protein n=1 Tax=unclassified Streptomyces TaxID=2593676 RepID=UPI0003712BE2|nr:MULTISPECIES: sterol desaturase family protein [unclassified Streptomyces]
MWTRRAVYPVLLLATVATAVAGLYYRLDPGLTTSAFQFAVIAYLVILERLIPYDRGWHPDRREWGWYGIYFLVTAAGSVTAQLLVEALVGVVSPARPALPLAVETPLALLVGSLASYLVHRWSHTNPWLWRLHGVHHVPQKVNVANNGVNHVLDVLLAQGGVQVSLSLLGFSQESVFAIGLFVITQGYFTHANIDVRIGWLNHLLASPEQHRLHHSTDLAEAGHYGSDLAVWDRIFGSYTWRPGRRPSAVGLKDPASFPGTEAVLASHLQAWRGPAG